MIRRCLTLTLTLSLILTTLFSPRLAAVHAQSGSVQQASAAHPEPLAAAGELGYKWPFESDSSRLSSPAGKAAPNPVSGRTIQDSSSEGDYGDAPDGSLAGYEVPFDQVVGRFADDC